MSKSILGLIVALFFALQLRAEQPIFNISSLADVSQGQIIDIDFHVDDFSQIISVQYSVNWNPAVLKFRSVKNFNSMVPGLSSTVFGTNQALLDAGKLTLSWIESSITPITIPDGSLFYTIEFEVVGTACQNSGISITDDPLEIEVAEVNEVPVGLVAHNGQVSVFGEGCLQDITINGNAIVGSCGSTSCVTFTVQNFSNVGAMEFSLVYNPTILQFNRFQNYAPLLSFGDGNTNLLFPGVIRVVWFNGNTVNESLPDGTSLFEVCFDVVGTGGQSSEVRFGDNPSVMISDIDGNLHNIISQPAQITAQCALQGFALIADTACATPNTVTCIDVKVNDFDDIVALQFSMNWDSTKFVFDHLEGFGIDGLDATNFGTPGNPGVKQGQLAVSWIDLSLNGVTLPDYSTIFRLCLKAVGASGTSTAISFANEPLGIEIATLDSVLVFGTLQGIAEINQNCGPQPCSISYTIDVTDPACPREATGAVDLTVTLLNCTDTPTYVWSLGGLTTEDLTGVPAGAYTVTITVGTQVVIANAIVNDPPPIGVTGTITDPIPPGTCTGAINITATGGNPPYTYLWSNNAVTEDLSNICAGSFSVTVTDSTGCTFIPDTYIVGAEVALQVTHVTCPGGSNGSICASASFGTAPYTYLWNNQATTPCINNLVAGSYCVTITDSASSSRDTCISITQPPALVVTASITHDTDENCKGAIDLNVTGGTPPYSYLWSNLSTSQDLINLCGSEYCVTITYGGGTCSYDTCFTIFTGGLGVTLVAEQYGNFQNSCNGVCDGEITSVVNGGSGDLVYHWSNGFATPDLTSVCPGTYTLTVTDNSGQSASASTTITAPPALNLTLLTTLPSDITASDGAISVVVSGGVPNYTYEWTGPVTGNTASLNNLPVGTYHIKVTDANGCTSEETVPLIPEGVPCYTGISVITPNDDGKNDYFILNCIFDYDNHLWLYNRYGGLVYETDNYANNWNGVDQDSEPLDDGGYFWVLEIYPQGSPKQVLKGTVNLLRTAD